MSGEHTSGGSQPGGPAGTKPSTVPRSGSGADTALEVMIKKRNMGTGGNSAPAPSDDTPTPPSKG